jgi:hypothetical protein
VDDGTGLYTITWDTDFASANYAIAGIAQADEVAEGQGNTNVYIRRTAGALAPGSAKISIADNYPGSIVDAKIIGIIAIGD